MWEVDFLVFSLYIINMFENNCNFEFWIPIFIL